MTTKDEKMNRTEVKANECFDRDAGRAVVGGLLVSFAVEKGLSTQHTIHPSTFLSLPLFFFLSLCSYCLPHLSILFAKTSSFFSFFLLFPSLPVVDTRYVGVRRLDCFLSTLQ